MEYFVFNRIYTIESTTLCKIQIRQCGKNVLKILISAGNVLFFLQPMIVSQILKIFTHALPYTSERI